MKDKIIQKMPMAFLISLGGISLYFTLQGITNYLFLMVGQFLMYIPTFVLFGDPTKPNLWLFVILSTISILGWLFSTKHPKFQTKSWRILWFANVFFGIFFQFLWLTTAPVYNIIVPYFIERTSHLTVESVWQAIAIGDIDSMLITFVFIPTIITCILLFWLSGQYYQYADMIKEAFMEFEFKNPFLQKWFRSSSGESISWPDVVLGPESRSKELVIQPGRDRTLNNIIVGSIGTGKTSALILPIINQDLHWMTKYINDFPNVYEREDFDTEDVKGRYLNGLSIIEPSNDLCQKAYQLVKAHGIPEESVFYIDPTNKNTPSINPMLGPVEEVAEAFAMVMEGLAEGQQSNFFFQQSERDHLKNYIYLLKLHNPEEEVTFDMLLQMYDNPNYVREMHEQLKKTIPENYEEIEDRDVYNHWAIVKQIDEWFDMNLLPKTGHNNVPIKITHGKYRNQIQYYDAKAEYVQGLRNVLNDIGANPLIRRVLFGNSSFDWDRHLEAGGVLLVNAAKGELGGLSNVLGKIVLLSLQNAVSRRKPNDSAFHHIIVDEFPDYIYYPFKEFPAQSRKYKAIVTVVAQTTSQLADKYGEMYMHTLLGALRHKMVYGDIPNYDAQLFSRIFSERERFDESVNEQAVSPLQEEPVLRKGNSYVKRKEPLLSPSDIIYQDAFQCAVKIVAHNKPIPVKQINANFVPKDEFKKAVIIIDEEAAEVWLIEREKLQQEGVYLVEEGVEVEEDIVEESSEVINETPIEHEQEMPITEEKVDPIIQPQREYPIPADYIFEEKNTSTIPKQVPKPRVEREPSHSTSTEVVRTVSFNDFFPKSEAEEAPVADIGKEQRELLREIQEVLEDTKRPKSESNPNQNDNLPSFTFYDEE